MGIYAFSATETADLNKRYAVGDTISLAQWKKIQRVCTVLSNARWSVKSAFASGWSFVSATLNWFLPLAGAGRFTPQIAISGASVTTWPTVYWRTMAGGYTFGSVTGTVSAATNVTWPTAVSSPASTRVYPAISASSYRAYREAAQYGCGRLVAGTITATTPLSVSIWNYPQRNYTNYAADIPMCQPGRYLAALSEDMPYVAVSADMLRACDAMLDQAETNPVILYALPIWTNGTGGTNLVANVNASALGSFVRMARERWVPLVNLGRRRSIWIAAMSLSWTSSTSIQLYVEVNEWRANVSGASFAVYRNGNYALFAVPIPPDAMRGSRMVDGIPLARVRVDPIGVGCSAWIGDSP